MDGVPMPYGHQFSFGAEKPSVPRQYNLSFTDNWSESALDIITIEREVPDASPIHSDYMKNLAMRNIKRFSRSKRIDDIKAYLDKTFRMGSQFAPGLPITIFDLISEGTTHFRK
jgi:hypothetical protein